MRNLVCILLFLVLCSNECNAPYKATIICRNTHDSCRFRFHNSVEFAVTNADVSWWKGSLEVGVYYRAKNASSDRSDSIDYRPFSVVCSNGMTFHQARRKDRSTVHSFLPAASLDSAFLFYSADRYSKSQGMKMLRTERFFLLYADGRMDTLLSLVASDSKIK